MKRAKPSKKKSSIPSDQFKTEAMKIVAKQRDKIRAEEIDNILKFTIPVYMLAMKDELKASTEEIEKVTVRAKRYFDYIGENLITLEDIERSLYK